MLRLGSKQTLKPMGVHHYHLRVRYLISTSPRRDDSEHDGRRGDGHRYDSTSGGASLKSHPTPPFSWRDFSQLDKDVSGIKLKLEHLESGQRDMKAEIKDLGGKLERKFDKTDSKVDRVLYGIITGLVGFVMKGGFDYYQVHKK